MLSGKYSYSRSALSLGYGSDELNDDGGGWNGCCSAAVVAGAVIDVSIGTVVDADRLGRVRGGVCVCVGATFCILAGGASAASGLDRF